MTAVLCASLVIGLGVGSESARAQSPQPDFYVTDGMVFTEALDGNTLYLGGSFSGVGPPTGSGVPLDATTGVALPGFPRVEGRVRAAVPDGAGGWFIGGDFTSVGGVPHNRIAHILADLSVAAWDPNANNTVAALAVDGGLVYAGGTFTSIGGQSRNRIAALDATTGSATIWDPNATSGSVLALQVSGTLVYAGGSFTNIGGQPRNRLAALDVTTGSATVWNPNANGTVSRMVVSGTAVYVAGGFTVVGGQTRVFVGAVDATSGLATAFDPGFVDNPVQALAVSGGTVYIGGIFNNIGLFPQVRNCIAALSAATGSVLPWNPNADSNVLGLAVSGGTVYATGAFSTIGGQQRNEFAALDALTGNATSWNPKGAYTFGVALSVGEVVAVSGSTVYVGGRFSTLGVEPRAGIAAVDVVSGAVTGWNPGANDTVKCLSVSGGVVYAGGSFTNIGGQPRNRIAALDPSTGLATGWDPNSDGSVLALAPSGGTIYAGGTFANIGGAARGRVAALDAGTGSATGWNPSANDSVLSLAATGGAVYAGGAFTSIGGQPRNRIAALDPGSALATAWDPNANGDVLALAVNGGTVYAGGIFGTVGGQPRSNIAGLDATSGLATPWDPGANDAVDCFAMSGGAVCAGGNFTSIGGQARNRVAALHPTTGLAAAWNPNANALVLALAAGNGNVYAGGGFSAMGGLRRDALAALPGPVVTFTISATAGPNGAIAPSGLVTLNYGDSQPYTITPDPPYLVADVKVDGVSVGAVTSYTFTGVQANHTIAATFALSQFTLASSVVGPGAVSRVPDQPAYDLGTLVTLTAVPGAGSVFTGWSGDTAETANPIDIVMTRNRSVVATFADTARAAVTVTAPNGGEDLVIGSSTSLTWTASDNVAVTSVDLLLSRNGLAGPFDPVATEIPNTGSYAWTVAGPPSTTALLEVVAHDAAANAGSDVSDAEFSIRDVTGVATAAVTDFELAAVWPDPARDVGHVAFALPRAAAVRLSLLDVQGREVRALVEGVMPAGRHVADVGGRTQAAHLAAGLYFVRYQVPGREFVRRFVLVE